MSAVNPPVPPVPLSPVPLSPVPLSPVHVFPVPLSPAGPLLIVVTSARYDQVLPARSTNSNKNVPLPVNVCVVPPLFVGVVVSEVCNIAVTGPICPSPEYVTVPVGAILSIQFTVAATVPVTPSSLYSNTKLPLSVNVCVDNPSLLVIVNPLAVVATSVATTSVLVVSE